MYTNRSRLVHVVESTEAVRAVSLSALAYAVTWPISNYHWRCATPPILRFHCLVRSSTNWRHRWWQDSHATAKGHESDTVMRGHGPADPL